jgi:protein NRD1
MTESLPALMNEMIPVTLENQKARHIDQPRMWLTDPKDKLSKLLDIWTTSKTFPSNMLADFKARLLNPSAPQMPMPAPSANKPAFSAPTNPANLLAALAAPPPAPAPAPAPPAQAGAGAPLANNASNALLAALGLAPPTQQPANPPAPMPYAQNGHNVTFPPQPPALPQNGSAMGLPFNGNHVAPLPPQSNTNPLAALFSGLHGGVPAAPADPNALASQISQIQMIQTLSQLGPDALKTIAAALSGGGLQPPPAPAAQVPASSAVQQPQYGQMPQGNQSYGREDAVQDPRARSRSPDFKRNRFSPPNRRDSPTYGTYDPSGPGNNGPRGSEHERGRRGRRGGRNDYRQRSPPNARDRDEDSHPRSNQPKPIGFDNKLPEGHIKGTSFCGVLNDIDRF